tara:strand:- start:90 stop:251 length:162 start_codon:yes stop_codon:yes gene_type:complete
MAVAMKVRDTRSMGQITTHTMYHLVVWNWHVMQVIVLVCVLAPAVWEMIARNP